MITRQTKHTTPTIFANYFLFWIVTINIFFKSGKIFYHFRKQQHLHFLFWISCLSVATKPTEHFHWWLCTHRYKVGGLGAYHNHFIYCCDCMRTLQVQIRTSVEFYKHGDRNFIQCVPYGTRYFIAIENITKKSIYGSNYVAWLW